MLADFLEELESLILTLHDGGHPTERGTLELLASVQAVTKLEQTDIVLGYLVDEMPGGTELTKGQLIVVLVI